MDNNTRKSIDKMTDKEKLAAAVRGQITTSQLLGFPDKPPATYSEDPGVLERFSMNADDAWKTNTSAGQAWLMGKAAFTGKDQMVKDEKQRQASYDKAKGWNDGPRETKELKYTDEMGNETSAVVQSDPNFLNTLAHGAAAITGQAVGNAATPETFINAPARLAVPAVQAATPAARQLYKRAVGAGTQAVVNAASDPFIQGSQVMLGVKDSFNLDQTATSVGLGLVTGGLLPQLPAQAREIERRNAILRAATGNPKAAVDDFHARFTIPNDLKGEKYIGSHNIETNKVSEPAYELLNNITRDNNQFGEARRMHLAGDIEQVKKLAEDNGRPVDYYLNRWTPGTVFNGEDVWTIRKHNANALEHLVTFSAIASARGNEEMLREAAVLYQRMVQTEAILQGPASEWGRVGAILNEPISSDERRLAFQVIQDKFGKILKPQEFFALVGSLEDPAMVRKFAREAEKATTAHMFIEAWKSGLLSSPDTHVANMIGSIMTTMMSIPEVVGASLIGKGRQAFLGGEDPVSTRAAVSRVGGLMQGAREGLRLAAHAFRTEASPGIQTKDVHQHIPDSMGGPMIRTPLRALLAEDTFFKTVNKYMALYQMGADEALKRNVPADEYSTFIRNFINNPPAHVNSKAEAIGKYYTFNAELGKMGNAVLQFKEAHPLASLLMPFVRTPINLTKQGLERSPFGFAYAAYGHKTGKLSGQELDAAISRATIGSGIMAWAAYQAYQGNIIGAGPMDPGKRENLTNTGTDTVSVRMPDGQFHNFSRAQPIGMTLGLAADYVQVAREYNDSLRSGRRDETDNPHPEALWRAAEYAAWATTKNMLQGSFVTQLNNLFDAMTAPDQNLSRFINKSAGSLVPTAVARIAQGADPVVREPQTMAETFASRIPGQTDKAPPMLNRFGEEKKREAGLVESMLWPFRRTQYKNDPTYEEIERLGVTFDDLNRYWEGRKLTPQQYADFVRLAGQPAKRVLDKVISSEGWQRDNFPDEIKTQEIRKIVSQFVDTAKGQMLQKYPELARENSNELIRKLQQEPRSHHPAVRRAREDRGEK
jgi:hypothetical protein